MELFEKITPKCLQLLKAEQAWQYMLIPFAQNEAENAISFYGAKSRNYTHIKLELELLLGAKIHTTLLEESALKQLLSKSYYLAQNKAKNISGSEDELENIIIEAKRVESSDIHFERYENLSRVRLRIDGKLVDKYHIKNENYTSLINKIKIRSNLDIAEKRLPQDGRMTLYIGSDTVDIRVSVLPTKYGEKAVLRLLMKNAGELNLDQLGFDSIQKQAFLSGINKPNGLILLSGPTGSGKTTTLYSSLKILNKETCNIITIEDPVEYTLEGINQVQLKESIGLTFSSALRSFLRQDPDVIMVGEIRDADTAQMAMRASLTGHLVLSTIHTNSAWGIVSRLADMGVPEYIISGTLKMVIAQRLVRLLCENCKQKELPELAQLPNALKNQLSETLFYTNVGCELCHYTGFKGRKAIYELITINDEIRSVIGAPMQEVNKLLLLQKVQFLKDKALALLKEGKTSTNEVLNIIID